MSMGPRLLSSFLSVAALLLLAAPAGARELWICADPNNLPFSNATKEGSENRIVDILAKDLHATVTYTWWAQRRGFIRNTLKAGLCDIMIMWALGCLAFLVVAMLVLWVVLTQAERSEWGPPARPMGIGQS